MKTPNAFQKFMHRILMLRPASAFFSLVLRPIDLLVLKWTRGRHSVSEIVGLNIVQLTTRGAKTGRPRTVPLVGLPDGDRIALICSNFGNKRHPAWFYNLRAEPRCTVAVSGRTGQFMARQAQGPEREKYWNQAVAHYRGYARYESRAAPRSIPVMILEPVKLLQR